jgi:hypothetical protein
MHELGNSPELPEQVPLVAPTHELLGQLLCELHPVQLPDSQSSPPGQSELTAHVCVQLPVVSPLQTWSPAHAAVLVQDAPDDPHIPPTHGAPPHWALLVQVHW